MIAGPPRAPAGRVFPFILPAVAVWGNGTVRRASGMEDLLAGVLLMVFFISSFASTRSRCPPQFFTATASLPPAFAAAGPQLRPAAAPDLSLKPLMENRGTHSTIGRFGKQGGASKPRALPRRRPMEKGRRRWRRSLESQSPEAQIHHSRGLRVQTPVGEGKGGIYGIHRPASSVSGKGKSRLDGDGDGAAAAAL